MKLLIYCTTNRSVNIVNQIIHQTQTFRINRKFFKTKGKIMENLPRYSRFLQISLCNRNSIPFFNHRLNNMKSRQIHKMARFGICFDVDGVLAKGPEVIPSATSAIQKLVNHKREWIVPVAFVTNSAMLKNERARYLTELLGVQVRDSQVVQAHTPLQAFTTLHDKFCFVVGQGDLRGMANEIKLKNVCTVDDISEAYPLLDMVDSQNRHKSLSVRNGKKFPKVEAVVLMGEPIKWETSLQLIMDVLRTNGTPDVASSFQPLQIPIFACSFDFEYKSRSHLPRLGHGAFLTCLAALYKKSSGKDLEYEGLTGKPTEMTFRFANRVLDEEARRMGTSSPLETMYMIGDSPDADIVGSNLYKDYVRRLRLHEARGCSSEEALRLANETLPKSCRIPSNEIFLEGTVERVEGLLVRTGVYGRERALHESGDDDVVGLNLEKALKIPDAVLDDVGEAVEYVLGREDFGRGVFE